MTADGIYLMSTPGTVKIYFPFLTDITDWYAIRISFITDDRKHPGCFFSQHINAFLIAELLFFTSHFSKHNDDTILSPTIDITSVEIKNNLQKVAGSLNTTMPIRTVPTAPMPVHIGYAVPRGIVRTAFARKNILNKEDNRNEVHQRYSGPLRASFVLPKEYVISISKTLAEKRKIQFIFYIFAAKLRRWNENTLYI